MFTFMKNGYNIYNMKREILFYIAGNGKCPIQEYLDTLKPDVVKKIFFVLDIIEEFDVVPMKFFKKLKDVEDIWEVRIEYKSNIYRLFGFIDKGKVVILTNGYQKKSQKTDKRQIELALKYKKVYLDGRK